MNRRQVLKSGVIATGSLLFRPGEQHFPGIPDQAGNTESYGALELRIGELKTYILSDGIISLPSVQPIFAPGITKSVLDDELHRLHAPLDRLETGINVMLIRQGDRVILLDAGSGHHLGPDGGKLIPALESLHLTPEDITDIVITHAHVDHIGGIVRADGEIAFPGATYHIAKKEHDFWLSDRPDFSNSKSDQASADFNISFARKTLAKMSGRLRLFDYGQTLFRCLIPELAEGHTPGHTIFTIHSQGTLVKHIVDAFHTPLLVSKPEWGTQWDTDFDKAVQTRKELMKAGAEDGTLFLSCHLPWPGLGFIDHINGSYRWQVYPYANPRRITAIPTPR